MEFKKIKPNIANFCWRWISILLILSMAFSLSSCGKSVRDTAISGSNSPVVYGATQVNGIAYTYQVCESGILYLSDRLAYYYDFDAKQSYVLCNRANCRHNDTSCPAYASSVDGITGLAYFQDAVYMVRKNNDASQFELIRYDLVSNAQKVVAALKIGSYEDGEWVIKSVANVVYAGNYAWMEITYGYISVDETGYCDIKNETIVITGIDLTTGEITRLNEITERNYYVVCRAVSENYVVFEKQWYEEPMLLQSEFQEAVEGGEYSEYLAQAQEDGVYNVYDDAYYFYQDDFMATVPLLYADMIYNTSTGSLTEFSSGKCRKVLNKDGSIRADWPGYIFDCISRDKLLYSVLTPEFAEDQFTAAYTQCSYSFSDGSTKELFTLPAGVFLDNGLVDESLVLCCEYTEGNQAQIFYYDLETGTRTDLFLDAQAITFRMVGVTEDSYIGIMYDETIMALDVFDGAYFGDLYQISKEDYEAGNLDAAEKISFNIFS